VNEKIKSLSELSDIIQALKRDGKTIVQCHGVFDLLHPGHMLHFEAGETWSIAALEKLDGQNT
jgi:bifunctional ADP-heptose synthase (sugar kinase/adenylyltransferase)